MQKKSSSKKTLVQLLLPALGYMVMGNLLSTVMSVSLAPFRGENLIMGMAVLFAMAIYLLLVAVPAYKDGLEENTRRKNQTVQPPPVQKWRWAAIGAILWGIMLVPSVVFLLGRLNVGVYRLICGAVNPMSMFLVGEEGQLLSYVPYVFMGFYALTVPACYIGFSLGLGDTLNKGKIMYD